MDKKSHTKLNSCGWKPHLQLLYNWKFIFSPFLTLLYFCFVLHLILFFFIYFFLHFSISDSLFLFSSWFILICVNLWNQWLNIFQFYWLHWFGAFWNGVDVTMDTWQSPGLICANIDIQWSILHFVLLWILFYQLVYNQMCSIAVSANGSLSSALTPFTSLWFSFI